MSGSGLIQFLINIIALFGAGAIFFLSIDKIAPDPFFAKIAKIAIGCLLLIAFIVTIAAVFGLAGGVTISPAGIIWFAVAVIVAVVVLYIVNLIVDWLAANMGLGPVAAIIKYVLGAVVLIALLVAAANFLFGVRMGDLSTGTLRRGDNGQTNKVGDLGLRGSDFVYPRLGSVRLPDWSLG